MENQSKETLERAGAATVDNIDASGENLEGQYSFSSPAKLDEKGDLESEHSINNEVTNDAESSSENYPTPRKQVKGKRKSSGSLSGARATKKRVTLSEAISSATESEIANNQPHLASQQKPHLLAFNEVLEATEIKGIGSWISSKGLEWVFQLCQEVCRRDVIYEDLPESSIMRHALDLTAKQSNYWRLLSLCVLTKKEWYFHRLSFYFDDSDLPVHPDQLAAVVKTFDVLDGKETSTREFIEQFGEHQKELFEGKKPQLRRNLEILHRQRFYDYFWDSTKLWVLCVPQKAVARLNCSTNGLIKGFWKREEQRTFRILTKEFKDKQAVQFRRELDVYRTIHDLPGVPSFKGSHVAIAKPPTSESFRIFQHILFPSEDGNGFNLERIFASSCAHDALQENRTQWKFWALIHPVFECMREMQGFTLNKKGDGSIYQGCHGNIIPKNIVQLEKDTPFFLTSWGHAAFRKKPDAPGDSREYHGMSAGNMNTPYYNPKIGPTSSRHNVSRAQHELWAFGAILFECILMITRGTSAMRLHRLERRKEAANKKENQYFDGHDELDDFYHDFPDNPLPARFHNNLGNPIKTMVKKMKELSNGPGLITLTKKILEIVSKRMLVNEILGDDQVASIYEDLARETRMMLKGKGPKGPLEEGELDQYELGALGFELEP
ncbi:hypothetical protein MKZ38_007415 [Zalerion maritima]|uniref:Protein kinase domain-containing protein n=1 Tax=Zalerion maritima TaxID=339359 RepID=A0AAD5WU70_9PEZI|nr:hypothetical protein MKZ38_007415 [Zalerion maritima]